jgi:hypothetical protein
MKEGKDYNASRGAGKVHREEAAKWAKLYRDAQAAGGRLLVNPNDDPEFHQWFDGTNPETLIGLLEDFARTGRFTHGMDFRPMLAKHVAARTKDGITGARLEAVMKEFNVGDRQARRLLSKRSAPG